MDSIYLSSVFWYSALMVIFVGGLCLSPFVLGLLDNRRKTREFRDRLHSGYYIKQRLLDNPSRVS